MTEPVRLTYPGATIDTLLETVNGSNLSATHKITRSATLVIAASDSSAKSKAQADYVCDGVEDNVEIQAAIDALSTTGGQVILLEGSFILSAQIDMVSYVNLRGLGMGATKIKIPNNTHINAIGFLNTVSSTLSDLEIDGNKANNASGVIAGADASQNCIHALGIQQCTITRCYLHDAIFHGIIMVHGSCGNVISFNRCENNGFRPIHSHTNCNYNTYEGNYCSGNGAADGTYGPVYSGLFVVFNGNSYNKIIGNTIVNEVATTGMQITGGAELEGNYPCVGNVFIGNVIDMSGTTLKSAVSITHAATLNNLILESNVFRGSSVGIAVESEILSNASIRNNNIHAVTKGIRIISGGDKLNITGNNIYATGEEPIYLNAVTASNINNNIVRAHSTWPAIKLVGSTYCNVENNQAYSAKYVIDEDANCNNNNIIGNIGTEIATAPYYNLLGSSDYIRGNKPYLNENTGTATITAPAATIDVPHGLAAAPTRVIISPTTATDGRDFYVSAKGATTFTITIDSPAEADAEISFDWQAMI